MPNRISTYELVERIASGGMAEIFLARRTGPEGFEKSVAIKRLLPHLAADPTLTAMFLDEARLAARLNHPKVVQIYDLGEEDGSFFIAMEYLVGEDLRAVLAACAARGIAVSESVVARIGADAGGSHRGHTHPSRPGADRGHTHGPGPGAHRGNADGPGHGADVGCARSADR